MEQLTTTGQFTQAGLERLEGFIDATSLSYVVSVLGEICFQKADHLNTNWQDKVAADLWNDAGELLGKIAERQTIKRVS